MLEVGRGLKNHLKKSSQRKKAKEKFELVNIILPEISKKSSELLDREEPDLSPVITQIMNAVFLEEELYWDKKERLAMCCITVHNYTARARAYTILAKWPEGPDTSMSFNPTGGRKEAGGLWAWRLDTLNPGSSTVLEFGISGLSKGDWNETDVFFRGNGEIIGATKMDEKLLDEQRKTEALEAAMEEVRIREEASGVGNLISDSEEGSQTSLDRSEESLPTTGSEWFGLAGDNQ